MTVKRLLADMDSWELTEWMGYYRIKAWERESGRSAGEFR